MFVILVIASFVFKYEKVLILKHIVVSSLWPFILKAKSFEATPWLIPKGLLGNLNFSNRQKVL